MISRRFLLALLPLVLAACSSVQFAYRNVDTLALWYVDGYVSLTPEQGAALRQRVGYLRQWHCDEQLPGLAAWLRETGGEFGRGVDAASVERRFDQMLNHLRRVGREAAPHLAAMLAGTDDAQVAEMLSGLERRDWKYREEWVDIPRSELERKRAEAMQERLEKWIGPLTPIQERRVREWAASLQATGEDVLETRRGWKARLREALAQRADMHRLAAEVEVLFARPESLWTPALNVKAQANRGRAAKLLADISASLGAEQRRVLAHEVASIAGEFDGMACGRREAAGEPPPAFPTMQPGA